MEKPIFNLHSPEHSIITFFCLQPVHLDNGCYLDLMTKKMEVEEGRWAKISDTYQVEDSSFNQLLASIGMDCRWMNALRRVHLYDLHVLLNKTTCFNEHLFGDFSNEKGEFSLLKGFDLHERNSGFVLGFDSFNKLFFILYKIEIASTRKINESEIGLLNQLNDLYKNVRSRLVADPENGNETVGSWAAKIHTFAVEQAHAAYANSIKVHKKHLKIPDNSGYIVCFMNGIFEKNVPELEKIMSNFYVHNHHIDNFKEDDGCSFDFSLLDDGKNQDVVLGWRHSTLLNIDQEKEVVLLPLFLHVQNMYFITHFFYKSLLSEVFSDLRYENQSGKLEEYIEIFDILVLSFEGFVYERERFLNDIKPVFLEMYRKIEEYWNLNSDYESVKKTILICKESVERKTSILINKAQNRQSNILFFLAIIQTFSIFSILTDYFNFYQLHVLRNQVEEYTFLRNYSVIILLCVTGMALVVAYYEKIVGTVIYNMKKLLKCFLLQRD